jgi:hypothetical protein
MRLGAWGSGTRCLGLPSDALDEALAAPFIASKERARVTTVVINDKGRELKKKQEDRSRESPYLSSSGMGLCPCGT